MTRLSTLRNSISAELEHVDFEATRGEIIEQRFDEFFRHVT